MYLNAIHPIFYICYSISARNRAEKKLYGFAFMRVTNNLQIVIKDGSHNLCIFKVRKDCG